MVSWFAAVDFHRKEVVLIHHDQFYTQSDVASFLGKKPTWLERSRWAGTGPKYVKIGLRCALRYAKT